MNCLRKFKDRIRSKKQYETVSYKGDVLVENDDIYTPETVTRVYHETIKTGEHSPESFNSSKVMAELLRQVAIHLYKKTGGEPKHFILFIRCEPELCRSKELDVMTAGYNDKWYGRARLGLFDTRLIDGE